jgi:hypothetical protein
VFTKIYEFFADLFSAFWKILSENKATDQKSEVRVSAKNRKNFASKDSGATILWKSEGI